MHGTSIANKRQNPFDANARQSRGLDYGYGVKNALRVTTIDFRRWRPIWFSAT
jgi:hypothetical protein